MPPAALKLITAVALAFGAAILAAAGHQEASKPDLRQGPPLPGAAPAGGRLAGKPAVDRHGDALPPGVIARLGTIRFRHPGFGARGLAFSRDGQMLVAGGEGNIVRAFEPDTGRLRREIRLGTFTLSGFALSPDGKLAALGGFAVETDDQPATSGIRLVEIATGRSLRTLGRKGGMDHCALAFTPDGKHIASVGLDGVVRVEEVSTGKELLQERFPVRYARLTFSGGGTCLAVGGSGGDAVWLWDWQSGDPPRQIKVPPRGANALSFSRNGKVLATGDEHQEGIRLWDVATGRLLRTVGAGEESAAARVCFSPDGRYLASTSRRRKVLILWDWATGEVVRRIPVRALHLGDLAWSGDSSRLALLDQGGVRLWDAATGTEPAASREGHRHRLSLAALLADGTAVTAGDDGEARLWDVRTSKPLRATRISDDWLADSAVSKDGRWLATSTLGEDHAVCLWEVPTGRPAFRRAGHGRHGGSRAVAFSAGGGRLLSWGDDMYLRVWEVRSGEAVAEHSVRPDGEDVPDLCNAAERRRRMGQWGMGRFSPDGGLLVLAGRDAFFVFDTKTGKQRRKIAHEQWSVQGMAINRDGTLLLSNVLGRSRDIPLPGGRIRSAAGKGAAALHDLTTGKLVREFPHTLRMPGPVAFSADGARFAVSTWEHEGRIELYDTATGALRSAIDKVPGRIWALGLSPDGERVIAGMEDSTALVWEWPEKPDRKR